MDQCEAVDEVRRQRLPLRPGSARRTGGCGDLLPTRSHPTPGGNRRAGQRDPGGKPRVVFRFAIAGDTIVAITLIANPDAIATLNIATVDI